MVPRKKGRVKTGGRKAGTPNVFTKTVRESVLEAFQKMQQNPKKDLLSFATNYPRDFYAIAAKLIPTEVTAAVTLKSIQVEYSNDLAKDSYTTSGATPSPEDEKTV